jgi:hypothetical protein
MDEKFAKLRGAESLDLARHALQGAEEVRRALVNGVPFPADEAIEDQVRLVIDLAQQAEHTAALPQSRALQLAQCAQRELVRARRMLDREQSDRERHGAGLVEYEAKMMVKRLLSMPKAERAFWLSWGEDVGIRALKTYDEIEADPELLLQIENRDLLPQGTPATIEAVRGLLGVAP